MEKINNWQGAPIEVATSRGRKVLAVTDLADNLITTGIHLWPPPEIVQKSYKSNHAHAFGKEEVADRQAVERGLGHYSDLQSLHSEDAITWSVFGTLAYATSTVQCAYVESLLNLLRVPSPAVAATNIWLWRRVPHPETLVSGGPEIDFGIQTEHITVFGEAKWLSGVAQKQGKDRDKDQIKLRREIFEKHGKRLFRGVSVYVLLGVSLHGGMLANETEDLGHASLHVRDTTWEAICGLEEHPAQEEIVRYLKWKTMNSRHAAV
jgi:hypothetical protein